MQDTDFWNRAAARYAKSPIKNTAAYDATLARVRAYMNATDRVLETGCGTGTTALKLAAHSREYLATDVSAAMIEIAKAKAADVRLANLAFKVADAQADPFESAGFNVVLGFNLLHLLRDLEGAIAEAHRVLEPGGLYITKTPCLGDMTPLLRLLLPPMQLIRKAPYVRFLRRSDLEKHIEDGGFDIIESTVFEGAPNSGFVAARKK